MLSFQSPLATSQFSLFVGCFVMAVAAWWCQWVRYPAFRNWTEDEFVLKHSRHTFQISVIVIPGMLLQYLGTAGLVWVQPREVTSWLHVLGCFLSIGPTLLVSGPIHGKLSQGKQADLIEKLIRTNVFRSVIWTAQCVLVFARLEQLEYANLFTEMAILQDSLEYAKNNAQLGTIIIALAGFYNALNARRMAEFNSANSILDKLIDLRMARKQDTEFAKCNDIEIAVVEEFATAIGKGEETEERQIKNYIYYQITVGFLEKMYLAIQSRALPKSQIKNLEEHVISVAKEPGFLEFINLENSTTFYYTELFEEVKAQCVSVSSDSESGNASYARIRSALPNFKCYSLRRPRIVQSFRSLFRRV